MSKMEQELERRLDENKYELYEALNNINTLLGMDVEVGYFVNRVRILTRKALAKVTS